MAEKRKRETREERRKEIMRIAAKLFANKGYEGASLSEVAAQMDISKAALYHHIQNKEEILKEICDGVLVRQMKETKRMQKSGLSPRDQLRWFIREVIRGVTEDKDVMQVIFENTNSLSPEAREKVRKQKRKFDESLELILKDGIKTGDFHIPDIKMAIFVIQGACSFGYQWYKPNGRLTPDEIADKMIYLLENGFIKQKAI